MDSSWYYVAINTSNDAGESAEFIEFMCSVTKASLMDAISVSDVLGDKATMRWKLIDGFLQMYKYIINADVRELCGVSSTTANRILTRLAAEKMLIKCHNYDRGNID